MKNFLILMTFIFSVACYASPPPVPVPQCQTDELQCIPLDQVQTVQAYTIENIHLQYVAVADIGSSEMFAVNNQVAEEVTPVKLPAVILIDTSYRGKYKLNKPPSDTMDEGLNRYSTVFMMNKQHTNFGYPLTADNC